MDEELQKLQDLLDMGFLQPEEFDERKNEILQKFGKGSAPTTKTSEPPPQPTPTYVPEPKIAQPEPTPVTQTPSSYYSPPPQPTTQSQPVSVVETPSPKPKPREPTPAAAKPPPELPSSLPSTGSFYSTESNLTWMTNPSLRSDNLEVIGEGKGVMNKGSSGGCLNICRASEGWKEGVHRWKIYIHTLPANSILVVGITRFDVNRNTYVGGGNNGWGYISNGSKVYCDSVMKYEAKGFKQGDMIGVEVDFGEKSLKFFRNGEDLGIAFRGISGTVYPAVSVPGPEGKGLLSGVTPCVFVVDQ